MTVVETVNEKSGVVVVGAEDVGAVATSALGLPGGVATLDGSGALTSAQLPSSAVSSSVAIKVLKESPGEATDCSKLIQEAYDAGYRWIVLDGTVPWYINGPVFFDKKVGYVSGALHQRVTIEGTTSAEIILGPNLPTTTAFTPDTAVKWAFWPGTLRTAYNAETNTVTCSEATAVKPGSQQGQPGVRYTGGLINGESRNVGLGFGNECSQIFGMNHRNLKFGCSWRGYTDHNGIERHTGQPGLTAKEVGAVENSWVMYQITNGDGMHIEPVEMDGGGVWHASQCHGGVVEAGIEGEFYFKHCAGIVFEGAHFQMSSVAYKAPGVISNCSQITVFASYTEPGFTNASEAQFPFLEVNDEEAETDASDIMVISTRNSVYANTLDGTRIPDIDLVKVNPNFRLVVDNFSGALIPPNGSNAIPTPILVGASQAAVKAALNHPTYTSFMRALTSSSRWTLARNGSGEAWLVSAHIPDFAVWPAQATPSGLSLAEATNLSGTLAAGEYTYAFAMVDDNGAFTKASAEEAVSIGATTACTRIKATLQAPGGLIIWRKKGKGVLAEPEAYAVLPWQVTQVRVYDTGVNIAGIPWVTTAVPVPNTVAAATAAPNGYTTVPGVAITQIQEVTATSSSYPVPPGATWCEIIAKGGGGGGGGGASSTATVTQVGGSGGSAGVEQRRTVALGVVKALNITIGAGGAGGKGGAANGSAGENGKAGSPTTVVATGITVRGDAGGAGTGAAANSTTKVLAVAYGNNNTAITSAVIPGTGAQSGGNAPAAASGASGAGGGGGGESTATNGGEGAKSGSPQLGGAQGAKGGSGTANGTEGEGAPANSACGGGGGGAGAKVTGEGGAGGAGGSGIVYLRFW